MAAMALDVLWQIFTRFILGDPSVWTEELARFILIWLGALGAAYGVGQGFHLEMDYFLQKAAPKRRQLMDRTILITILVIALGVFFVGGGRLLLLSHQLGQTSPALGLHMTWVYLALPVSGLLMAFSALHRMRHPLDHSQPQEPID
jgi:TRAP-type C4-dicarboxylate transport system permease small subunit